MHSLVFLVGFSVVVLVFLVVGLDGRFGGLSRRSWDD